MSGPASRHPSPPGGLTGDLPPLHPDLLATLGNLAPVKTRAPLRTLVLLAATGAALAIGFLLLRGLRPDLHALPPAWVAVMAMAWATGLAMLLMVAVLPRRGDVLPDSARAGRAALVAAAGLLALGLVATVDAPGVTRPGAPTPAAFAALWWHCTRISLALTAPFLLVGGLCLRRLFPLGGRRAAAALGAAGGAVAGLALHFSCPVGGGLHVGLAHAGGVALGALLGMLLLPRLLRS